MMKPLQQWICDNCGNLIKSVDDGWVEWLGEDYKAHSFRIVHNYSASPRKPQGDCFFHTDEAQRKDNHLECFTGKEGMPRLLAFLDLGPKLDEEGIHTPLVSDIREFVELMRRLTVPFYEEARMHWPDAEVSGLLDGMNEVSLYSPNTNRGIIQKFGMNR